jgi:hypothetical protein
VEYQPEVKVVDEVVDLDSTSWDIRFELEQATYDRNLWET